MPVHVEDFGKRAEEILRCTMAVETPFHTQGLGLIDDAHFIHGTVATVAAHAAVHMDSMIEVGVIR